MEKDSKIYVAGHKGFAGSSIVRELTKKGYTNLVLRIREELDLADAAEVAAFFEKERPEYVFDAAAKVGGIQANSKHPVDFINNNIAIQNGIIVNAYHAKVKKMIFLGSSCIYPKVCPQPTKEEYFMDGKVEPTSEAYAVAKMAGIEMCRAYNSQYGTDYVTLIPGNLYGENDHFELENSHVISALLRKLRDAEAKDEREIVMLGSGAPTRDFIYVDDFAEAAVFLMEQPTKYDFVNVGTGKDVSIRELVEIAKEMVKYDGAIRWDTAKPDGIPRRRLDTTRLEEMGWKYRTELSEGLSKTNEWFLENIAD